VFDLSRNGSFSKEDFFKIFQFSPIMENDRQGAVRKNLDKCFEYLRDVYGESVITPKTFAEIINHGNKS